MPDPLITDTEASALSPLARIERAAEIVRRAKEAVAILYVAARGEAVMPVHHDMADDLSDSEQSLAVALDDLAPDHWRRVYDNDLGNDLRAAGLPVTEAAE